MRSDAAIEMSHSNRTLAIGKQARTHSRNGSELAAETTANSVQQSITQPNQQAATFSISFETHKRNRRRAPYFAVQSCETPTRFAACVSGTS